MPNQKQKTINLDSLLDEAVSRANTKLEPIINEVLVQTAIKQEIPSISKGLIINDEIFIKNKKANGGKKSLYLSIESLTAIKKVSQLTNTAESKVVDEVIRKTLKAYI